MMPEELKDREILVKAKQRRQIQMFTSSEADQL